MEVDFTECIAHSSLQSAQWTPAIAVIIIVLPMLLRVLLLCFLKISSWINTVFLALIDGHNIMFILQPHEGKKVLDCIFPQLVSYLTNYTTTGCWISLVTAVRDNTDTITVCSGHCLQMVLHTVRCLCSCWCIFGAREISLTHQGSSALLSIGFCTIFYLNKGILG